MGERASSRAPTSGLKGPAKDVSFSQYLAVEPISRRAKPGRSGSSDSSDFRLSYDLKGEPVEKGSAPNRRDRELGNSGLANTGSSVFGAVASLLVRRRRTSSDDLVDDQDNFGAAEEVSGPTSSERASDSNDKALSTPIHREDQDETETVKVLETVDTRDGFLRRFFVWLWEKIKTNIFFETPEGYERLPKRYSSNQRSSFPMQALAWSVAAVLMVYIYWVASGGAIVEKNLQPAQFPYAAPQDFEVVTPSVAGVSANGSASSLWLDVSSEERSAVTQGSELELGSPTGQLLFSTSE